MLLGWQAVHYKEAGEWDTDHGRVNNTPVTSGGKELNVVTVDNLEALREVWQDVFL